ncbi:alpha-glucosidase [Arsenicicoccus cauae]|uniref:alpha-glucosidase n=1 Tax=Arsenicicoccus cauae TaxID=2663847 RepID=UPI00289B4DE6|nr:alpha-glucosidase [Arsenicicoccus cauae]
MQPARLTFAPGVGGTRAQNIEAVVFGDRLQLQRDNRVVWTSPTNQSFVTAARSTVAYDEHRGYFWPQVDTTRSWTAQTVDSVRAEGNRIIVGGRLKGSPDVPYTMTVSPRGAGGLDVLLTTTSNAVDALGFQTGRTRGRGVHGFGEQFDSFDLSGRLIPLLVREQGVGRGEQPVTFLADATQRGAGGARSMTYAAYPTFVTDDLRGVRLAPSSPEAGAFGIADTRNSDRVGLQIWSRSLHLELTSADFASDLLAQQQGPVTRPTLAKWTQDGLIVGVQGGSAKVRDTVRRLKAAGVRVAGVWIQDWTGGRTTSFGDRLWWTWQPDPERYPDWKQLVGELQAQGVRTTTYVNPFLTDASGRPGTNLYAQAAARGYLIRDVDGQPYQQDQGGFSATMVDLTNPAARQWFSQVIAHHVLADGVVGFMADFAEGLPMDARLHSGDPRTLHNRWPKLWAETVKAGCAAAGRTDCVTWFRSGTPDMASDTPLFWTGDQLVTWSTDDGLASSLLGTFSAGVSGWALDHSDLGGYTSVDAVAKNYVRSPELLQRWGEVAAFGVVMRSHEGNRPAQNLQVYDPTQVAATARSSRIFAALAPYRATVLDEATRDGIPAVRHTWVNWPNTTAAANDRQFFLGQSVLVAPVLSEGSRTATVSFPPGTWVNIFTGRSYAGGATTNVPAPLGTPAAFVRADDPWLPKIQAALRAQSVR